MLFLVNACWATQQFDKFWSLVTINGNYGKNLYYIEPQLRLIYRDKPFQQFLTNYGLGYQTSKEWQLWLGQTFSADSQDAVAGSQDEYRIWEQAVWTHCFIKNQFISRTRLEERRSLSFNDWAIRLRERLYSNFPLTNNMALVIYDELFLNGNNANWIITKRFDQNRAYIGLEQQLAKNIYFSAGYLNQYLSTPNPQSNQVFVLNWRFNLQS